MFQIFRKIFNRDYFWASGRETDPSHSCPRSLRRLNTPLAYDSTRNRNRNITVTRRTTEQHERLSADAAVYKLQ